MTMRLLVVFALAWWAAIAAAAPCSNCHGDRVVGTGPVRFSCPVCDGTGSVQDVPRPAVARIEAADGPSRAGGSGVLVAVRGGHGIVLTNWHVVRSHRDGITVRFPDGATSAGRVLASDDVWDLAALLVTKPDAEPVTIAAKAPSLGDRLTIAGYGSHPFTYRESAGACTEFLSPTASHAREFVELQATARQGDSGGPIFDERGDLAGVLFGTKDGLTVGTCSTRLRAFLAGVKWPACRDGRCR